MKNLTKNITIKFYGFGEIPFKVTSIIKDSKPTLVFESKYLEHEKAFWTIQKEDLKTIKDNVDSYLKNSALYLMKMYPNRHMLVAKTFKRQVSERFGLPLRTVLTP